MPSLSPPRRQGSQPVPFRRLVTDEVGEILDEAFWREEPRGEERDGRSFVQRRL